MADLLLLALASAELPNGVVLLDGVICLLKTGLGSKVHFHRPLNDRDMLTTSATAELGWM